MIQSESTNFLGIAYASSIIIERLVTVCVSPQICCHKHTQHIQEHTTAMYYGSFMNLCINIAIIMFICVYLCARLLCCSRLNDILQECNPSTR